MRLTVEHFIYLLIGLIAAALRLFALDAHPLAPHEAINAWSAWVSAMGTATDAVPQASSALYHTLQTLLFWPAFGGDLLARLLPALVGSLLPVLPWWWRGSIGRLIALSCALLMSLDPWLIAMSRMADGAIFSIFLALVVLTCLMQLGDRKTGDRETGEWEGGEKETESQEDETHKPIEDATSRSQFARLSPYLAVAFGLLLASGPLAWSFLPVLLLYLLLSKVNWQGLLQRNNLLIALASFVLAATGWLSSPQSFRMVSASLNTWVANFVGSGVESSSYPISWWLTRLLVDQPLLLIFGFFGLLLLLRRIFSATAEPTTSRWVWFVLLWLLWGIILGLAPGRSPFALPLIGLPLIFASAAIIDSLLRRSEMEMVWEEGSLLTGILIVLTVAMLFSSLWIVNNTQFDLLLLRPIFLMIGLAVVLLLLFTFWLDVQQAILIGGGVLGVILLVMTTGATWRLNYVNSPMTPSGFWRTTSHPDVRNLANDVTILSAQRTGDAGSIAVQVKVSTQGTADPVLGWYLRTMRNLNWVEGVVNQTQTGEDKALLPILIAARQDEQLASVGETYMGSRYRLYQQWSSTLLQINSETLQSAPAGWLNQLSAQWSAGWRARLRWLLYREMKNKLPVDEVTLWVP